MGGGGALPLYFALAVALVRDFGEFLNAADVEKNKVKYIFNSPFIMIIIIIIIIIMIMIIIMIINSNNILISYSA